MIAFFSQTPEGVKAHIFEHRFDALVAYAQERNLQRVVSRFFNVQMGLDVSEQI